LGQLPAWLQQTDWVIDLLEWRRSPRIYDQLELPAWLQTSEQIWLIIPLVFRDRVEGVLMLKRSDIKSDINWEDRDLLKTAGRQAASHLAQHLASDALVEARQFDAFNRLSAYVAHDLKNILAQQSLIISNAARHRNNPAFVDDMIATIENSVGRMQRLMEQMRSGIRTTAPSTLSVASVLNEAIASRRGARPQPCGDFTGDAIIEADPERLGVVFNHLLQNAQEATAAEGRVVVRLTCHGDWVKIEIEDSGSGMSAEFIRERLFRPFESTKGLTGMGVGAFESREYIRQLGGDITVSSRLGEGSIFYVTIPRAPQQNTQVKLLSADSGS
jgi:putative PEP-CTERM system histidine kinase